MMDDEKWARFGVGIGHSIGSIFLTAFGGGALVPVVGNLENMALDAAFADRIAPSKAIAESSQPTKLLNPRQA